MKTTTDLVFDRDGRTIRYNGNVIIDFGPVSAGAKARLYSKLDKDTLGYETVFTIREERKPFDLGFLILGTEGFIAAAVENRLEIEGMLIHDGIQEAYREVWSKKSTIPRDA